jgi:pyruvate/2-oxoglutarate dehydrogenase complex dihydrolipoamide acyltransferase (E2) component
MFGSGWGIPLAPMTVMVTIGGITTRPVLVHGEVTNHDFLPLTMSFDHTVIDGAPAARFATAFRGLLESAAVLEEERNATLVQG